MNGQTSAETTRWRIKGDTTTEETFTRSDLKALASGGTVGYQFWKKGTENLVAATEYVTLDALLQSAGASFREEMYVTAADATGFSAQLSYVDYTSCRYYVTADGDKIDAPAAQVLTWASGTGTLEEVAAKAENSGSIRFCYGISAGQYGSAAGKRLVSGLTAGVRCTDCGKVISGCETIPATGHDTELVGAVAAICTEDGYTGGEVCKVCQTVVKKGETIPATGHDYKDGKCSRCGAEEPTMPVEPGKPGEPSQPTQPEKPTTPDTPATGDSSNVTALWVVLAVAGVGIIVLVVLLVTKGKNKKD